MLKLALGIDLQETIVLTDSLESLAISNIDPSITQESLEMEKNADYQIAYNFTQQRRLEYKLERAKALPTIGAFVNYGTQAFGEDFKFFEKSMKVFEASKATMYDPSKFLLDPKQFLLYPYALVFLAR